MNDFSDFQRKHLELLMEEEKEELANHEVQINSFKEFMAEKGIHLDTQNFKFIYTIGVIAEYPGIINHLHPALFPDKEGLFGFDSLCKNFRKQGFVNGYLYGDNFIVMAHPYFRRELHGLGNYAPRFIEFFWDFDDNVVVKYISLDPDRVRINIDHHTCMELDTWYGAKFNKDINEIPDGIVKLRPPLDIMESLAALFFRDAYSLDIKWATKDYIRSFQAEEFRTEAVKITKDGVEYYPVRYVHAEYDISKKSFRHFDGAIHFYTEQEYYARRDSDFNYNSKEGTHIKTLSQKLFKMNGLLSIDNWVKFTSHFFTGNPLIFEYFEGEYPLYIRDAILKVRLNERQL